MDNNQNTETTTNPITEFVGGLLGAILVGTIEDTIAK